MANQQGYLGNFNSGVSVAIANSATSSDPITTGGMSLCGIKLPAAFTGTALTFTMCDTVDGTYVGMKKADGTDLSYVVAQNTYVIIDPKDFQGVNFFKIKSGSTEGGARTLVCSLKGV